jgi:hypothetical protein
MSEENVAPETNEELAPKHALREPEQVADPATEFETPDEVPGDHDDVDVALQDGKDTQDGPGDEEVPEADFQGYADPSAEVQEEQN